MKLLLRIKFHKLKHRYIAWVTCVIIHTVFPADSVCDNSFAIVNIDCGSVEISANCKPKLQKGYSIIMIYSTASV